MRVGSGLLALPCSNVWTKGPELRCLNRSLCTMPAPLLTLTCPPRTRRPSFQGVTE